MQIPCFPSTLSREFSSICAILQEGDGSSFPSFFGLNVGNLVSEQIEGSVQCPAQERCGCRRKPNTSNCAYWSAPTVERAGTSGRTPPWTGCVLHVTVRDWKTTPGHSLMTELTTRIPVEEESRTSLRRGDPWNGCELVLAVRLSIHRNRS